jgi:hypothetical protein
MANFVKPFLDKSKIEGNTIPKTYEDSSFGSSLSTFITNSSASSVILGNLPMYRIGLSCRQKGLEIGMAHGYFLVGPFTSYGPLRNTEIANFAGLLSALGLIFILSIVIAIYGYVTKEEEEINWGELNKGFIVGAFGSAIFSFELLNTIKVF